MKRARIVFVLSAFNVKMEREETRWRKGMSASSYREEP